MLDAGKARADVAALLGVHVGTLRRALKGLDGSGSVPSQGEKAARLCTGPEKGFSRGHLNGTCAELGKSVLWPGNPATAPDGARYFLNRRRRAAAAAPMPSRLTPRMASDAGSGTVCENCFSRLDTVPPGNTPRSSVTTRLETAGKSPVECRALSVD